MSESRFPIIRFSEYRGEGQQVIINLETVPTHQRVDYLTRNENILAGVDLCTHCDGTGNEFFSMYRECSECKGTGRKVKNDK